LNNEQQVKKNDRISESKKGYAGLVHRLEY